VVLGDVDISDDIEIRQELLEFRDTGKIFAGGKVKFVTAHEQRTYDFDRAANAA
jgi:hypothetical protein